MHCRGGTAVNRVPSCGRSVFQASETVDRQALVYHSALIVQDRDRMTGFGEEDRDGLFGSASRSLEFRRWALTWEKLDVRLLFGFRVILVCRNFVTRDNAPDALRFALVKFLKHVMASLHPTHPLFLGQLVGHPTGATLPYS